MPKRLFETQNSDEVAIVSFVADRPNPSSTNFKVVFVSNETIASDGTSGTYYKVSDGSGGFAWQQS